MVETVQDTLSVVSYQNELGSSDVLVCHQIDSQAESCGYLLHYDAVVLPPKKLAQAFHRALGARRATKASSGIAMARGELGLPRA
jgi:hypothetical protein